MAPLEKQRTITRGHSAVGMSRGVADDIGLGLNDATGEDAFGQCPHQYLSNEIAGEGGRIDGQLRTSERPIVVLMAPRFQGIRSTHCAREGPGSKGSLKYCVSWATFPSRNSIMLTV